MKRFIAAAGTVVAAAAMSAPAFASDGYGRHHNGTQPSVKIVTVTNQSNWAVQKSEVSQDSTVVQKGHGFIAPSFAFSANGSTVGQSLFQMNK